jgi:hypothetical protein
MKVSRFSNGFHELEEDFVLKNFGYEEDDNAHFTLFLIDNYFDFRSNSAYE